jgi:MFS superfamily sulfate permease-like transporter
LFQLRTREQQTAPETFARPRPSGIFTEMNPALKWILGLLGLALLMASPYVWKASPILLWLIIPLLGAWAFWLMMEYLRWAKTLGKK